MKLTTRHLAAHHPQIAQEGICASTQGPGLIRGEDHKERAYIGTVSLAARDSLHPHPEVVVGREKDCAYEYGLDYPQPGQEAAHHRNPHRLVESVDLAGQDVAEERRG